MSRYLVVLMALMLGGCNEQSQSNLPTTRMTIGSRTFTLEIADDPVEREIGLMRRDSMPAGHGMIFVFPSEVPERRFWMKNTRIPLDILFVNTEGRVVALGQMEPHIGEFGTQKPSRYAIELNKGMAARAGVKEGDVLAIPTDVASLQVPR